MTVAVFPQTSATRPGNDADPICYGIVVGAIQGELTFYGTWDDSEDATFWAEGEMRGEHWELVPIYQP